ncbi:MAG: aminoacyl--tRNA ligase-related protein [bacterium]|nr:aminoacyl--tRNA ligase-related protein [bacterium]
MKQSKYFAKTLKDVPKEETSINAQLLIKGRYIDKLMAGVYTLLPLGLRVVKKIENIIREEMNAVGGQELFMPALHPIENYITTKRDQIDILFHLESITSKKMVLGMSHEEVITPLVKQYINSYKDLPISLYQIQTKFRNELRAKSGILRGREFIMKDLYSFHADEKDFEEYYNRLKVAYKNIFSRVGLGDSTYLTFASGGSFSKFSHEFQTITESGEDTIYLCEKCNVAVNNEIIDTQDKCPECGSKDLTKKKSIEVGNIFPLKTKFSDAFGLKYTDKDGKNQPIIMGCYGIGLTRLMGAVAEIYNDKDGLVWPETLTPFDVHLVLLGNNDDTKKQADKVYDELIKAGKDVLYDDRDESAGKKLKDADLIGISRRLIISEKTDGQVEYKLRNQEKVEVITIPAAIKRLKDK